MNGVIHTEIVGWRTPELPEGHEEVPKDALSKQSHELSVALAAQARIHGLEVEERETGRGGELADTRVQRNQIQYSHGGSEAEIVHKVFALATGGAVLAFLREVKPLIIQWMKNRASRSVTIKTHHYETTAKGEADIEHMIRELERKQRGKDDL